MCVCVYVQANVYDELHFEMRQNSFKIISRYDISVSLFLYIHLTGFVILLLQSNLLFSRLFCCNLLSRWLYYTSCMLSLSSSSSF